MTGGDGEGLGGEVRGEPGGVDGADGADRLGGPGEDLHRAPGGTGGLSAPCDAPHPDPDPRGGAHALGVDLHLDLGGAGGRRAALIGALREAVR
ncbi:hypothetical protein R6L23_36860, partial [Streptomyces sp. SR27]|nr:hypothetical protein [Streptomyces sp. SR27]